MPRWLLLLSLFTLPLPGMAQSAAYPLATWFTDDTDSRYAKADTLILTNAVVLPFAYTLRLAVAPWPLPR